MVGGDRRDVTELMVHVPGLMAKDGAEGVFAAALPGRPCGRRQGRRRCGYVRRAAGARRRARASRYRQSDAVRRVVQVGHGPRRAGRRGPFDRVSDRERSRRSRRSTTSSTAASTRSPAIRRVIAENPSKFTYRGTGTYIVGHGDVVVIDPGPVLDSHRDALAAALAGERVRAILITHCHADHSPLAAWLRAETGAPTFAFGPHGAVDAERRRRRRRDRRRREDRRDDRRRLRARRGGGRRRGDRRRTGPRR